MFKYSASEMTYIVSSGALNSTQTKIYDWKQSVKLLSGKHELAYT